MINTTNYFARLLLGFGLCHALTGCGNKTTSPVAATNAPTGGGSVVTAPVDYLGALGRAQQSAVKTIDTTSLKSAVQLFQAEQGTLPKSLDELVEKKYLPRIPATPFGTRLNYDPSSGDVTVVKQESH